MLPKQKLRFPRPPDPPGGSTPSRQTTPPKVRAPSPSSGEVASGRDPVRATPLNDQFVSDYQGVRPGFGSIGGPQELAEQLERLGYQCLPFLAVELALLVAAPCSRVRALLLEGPSGCGKSFLAKSLAKLVGADLFCLSCYKGIPTGSLLESPSTLAVAGALAKGGRDLSGEDLMNLGIVSRAFLRSQQVPTILLVDELDKADESIDTFFLGPIQDSRVWLESRPAIDADTSNLLLIFTKNYARPIDEALLRRCHPIRMTYLDSALERKILSEHCHPQLIGNLVGVADRMRNSGGSYEFERPPAPEELLAAGHYVMRLLDWGFFDFALVGRAVWNTMAKSDHDRAVLEHMLRYHPDFIDPLVPDSKNASIGEIYGRFGRVILEGLVYDPHEERRRLAWRNPIE